MSENMKRWRGLAALVGAAVEHGATAIQRVHMATARRPFSILEQIPGIATPATIVDTIHAGTTAGVYGTIRLITRGVTLTVDAVLEALDTDATPDSTPAREQTLLDHGVDSPVTVDHLRDAEIDRDRHQ